MDKRKLKKIIIILSIIVVFFIIFSIVVSYHAIYTGVKRICVEAKQEYGQDCVNSLARFIKSDEHTIKKKTHAIWALGQLADARAITYLKEFQKKFDCEDDSKKSKICYEILKALKWCEQGNATSWMYKNRSSWN
ncbi:MAG TPA: hypothetical protein ENG70_05910 [Candidatus Cloacimonetes bacterium]|nr:hypothetical protein [Candidatus Cloacimonadota bacterium]HEX38366.1 hypothetical protein [Candidatus Cloacimonadota bacterium]